MGFWDDFSIGNIIGSAVGPTIKGVGDYFIADQGRQDSLENQQRQNEFTQQQAAEQFQREQDLIKLRAALDSSGAAAKAAVKVAKIKAQTDREKMLQEAYIASMSDALSSGNIIGNQLGGVAERITNMRLR